MKQTLIRATELAEFVYCSKAWHLKYLEGAGVSPEARELQIAANAWHVEKGRWLARGTATAWHPLLPWCWGLLDGMGEMTVLLMGITAIALALVLYWLSVRSRRSSGIPDGEVFYQDLGGQPFAAENLRSLALGISGKPDCLIRTAEGIVPVELKHSNRPPARGGSIPIT